MIDKVSSLEETVKLQKDQICALEEQITQIMVEPINYRSRGVSRDQAEGGQGEQMTSESRTPPKPPQSEDDTTKPPPTYAAMAKIGETKIGGTQRQKLGPGSQNGSSQQPISQRESSNTEDEPFRHSVRERKNIQRGNVGFRAAVKMKDIRGSSTNAFCISSTSQTQTKSYLVYVGNLDVGTTEENLRKHLLTVKVKDVADVISLRGKQSHRHVSFCISFNNENSMRKVLVFEPTLWPVGVVVRPFHPSKRQMKSRPQPRHLRYQKRRKLVNPSWHNRFESLSHDGSQGYDWGERIPSHYGHRYNYEHYGNCDAREDYDQWYRS